MRPRLLLAVVLLASAAGLVVLLADEKDEPARPPSAAPPPSLAQRTLARQSGGPAGSPAIALARWRYRADPRDAGRADGWAEGGWEGRAVTVPHSPNARTVQGPAARRSYAGSVGWYAREVTVPVDGLYAVSFESAHHRATVYVDGRPVRGHVGAYEPFSARPRLARGRHTIAVRVDWRDPERQARTGFARGWFNFGGLNRPVTFARLGASELGAVTVRTRLRDDGRARVDVSARVRNRAAARELRVRGTLRGGARERVALDFGAARTVRRGRSRTVRASIVLDDPALWSPERPDRHALAITVPGEAAVRRQVGLRELRWGTDGLRINGEPLVLRGAAVPPDARGHGDALTSADEARIVRQLEATGANATRSQLPLSESLLERLDATGILVWQEIGPWEPAGAWSSDSPEAIAAARDRALRTAEAHQPHASILAWTLTNEVAGQGQPEQQRYVAATARALRERDRTRPIAADLWGLRLTRADGPLFTELDAIGVTDYVGWYEGLDLDDAGRAAIVLERVARMRALFPDKPVVVTELGAAGTERAGGGDAFGGLRFQAALLAERLRVLRDAPGLSGALVWSLRDYALRPDFRGGSVLRLRPDLALTPGLNEKGLFDYRGEPKPSLEAVRRAFGRGG